MSEMTPPEEISPTDAAAQRREAVEALRQAKIDPYPPRVERTHSIGDALAQSEALMSAEKEITVCGRVGPIRMMGKAAFFHLTEASGKLQVYMKKNILGDEAWEHFRSHLEFCDFAQVTGTLFVTKTGETTIQASGWKLLTKTIRALPKEHFGLKDRETRYRRRHADLAANPEVREVFLTRARIISEMRRWLESPEHEFGNYVEVETPVLHAIPGGAAARPFETHHNALGLDLFMRIALELHHKRCVVGGIERVYEIGRIFRNEGISTRHNPEFTMLELYTAYVDVSYTERLMQAMIQHLAQVCAGGLDLKWGEDAIHLGGEWPRVPLCEIISRQCGNTVHPGMTAPELRDRLGDLAREKTGVQAEQAAEPLPEEPGKLLLEVFERHIEHTLMQPTMITLFPKSVSPLVKASPDDPLLAERSELYMGGLEIAPMYTELNDPAEQRQRFVAQMAERLAGDDEAMLMDTEFLDALEHGMPPTSGLGLGVDRLVMLLTNQQSIRDVILFPLMRPEI